MRSKLEVCPPRQSKEELRRKSVCLGIPNYKPGESSKKGKNGRRVARGGRIGRKRELGGPQLDHAIASLSLRPFPRSSTMCGTFYSRGKSGRRRSCSP